MKQVKFLWQHVWRKQYSAAPQMVPRLNEYGEELDEDNEDDGIGMLGKEEMFQGVPNVPRRVNSESDLLTNNNGNSCNNVNNLMNNTITIKNSIKNNNKNGHRKSLSRDSSRENFLSMLSPKKSIDDNSKRKALRMLLPLQLLLPQRMRQKL